MSNLFPQEDKGLDPEGEVKLDKGDDGDDIPKIVKGSLYTLVVLVIALLCCLAVWGIAEVVAQIKEAV